MMVPEKLTILYNFVGNILCFEVLGKKIENMSPATKHLNIFKTFATCKGSSKFRYIPSIVCYKPINFEFVFIYALIHYLFIYDFQVFSSMRFRSSFKRINKISIAIRSCRCNMYRLFFMNIGPAIQTQGNLLIL